MALVVKKKKTKTISISLFVICISFSEMFVKDLAYFLTELFIFLLLSIISPLYIWKTVLYHMCFLFPPSCGLSSNFLDGLFFRPVVFNFNKIQLISSFFHGVSLLLYLKRLHRIQSHLGFLLCNLLGVYTFEFYTRTVIHFKLHF